MKGLVLIMARFCEKCGTQLDGVEAFCPNCGAPVAAGPETPAAETAAETVAAEMNAAETAAAPAAPAEESASGSADGAPAAFEYSEPAAPAPAAAPEAAENAQQGFAYGAPAAPAPAPAPAQSQYQQTQPQYQQAQPQPQYQQAQPQYTVVTAATEPDQTVSTARFFWFRILFVIPFVGFILSIIMSFAPRNVNFKHFARSYMIMYFIGIGLVLVGLIIALAGGAALSDIFRYIPDISYMF